VAAVGQFDERFKTPSAHILDFTGQCERKFGQTLVRATDGASHGCRCVHVSA